HAAASSSAASVEEGARIASTAPAPTATGAAGDARCPADAAAHPGETARAVWPAASTAPVQRAVLTAVAAAGAGSATRTACRLFQRRSAGDPPTTPATAACRGQRRGRRRTAHGTRTDGDARGAAAAPGVGAAGAAIRRAAEPVLHAERRQCVEGLTG